MQGHSILSSLVNTRIYLSFSAIVYLLLKRLIFCYGFKKFLGSLTIGPVSDLLDAYNLVDYARISGGRHRHVLDSKLFSTLTTNTKGRRDVEALKKWGGGCTCM